MLDKTRIRPTPTSTGHAGNIFLSAPISASAPPSDAAASATGPAHESPGRPPLPTRAQRPPPPVPRRCVPRRRPVIAAQVFPESVWAQDVAWRARAHSRPLTPGYLGVDTDGLATIVPPLERAPHPNHPAARLRMTRRRWARWPHRAMSGRPSTRPETRRSRSCALLDAFRPAAHRRRCSTRCGHPFGLLPPIARPPSRVLHHKSNRRLGYARWCRRQAALPARPRNTDFKKKVAGRSSHDRAIYDMATRDRPGAVGLDVFRDGCALLVTPPFAGVPVKTLTVPRPQCAGCGYDHARPFKPHLFQPLGACRHCRHPGPRCKGEAPRFEWNTAAAGYTSYSFTRSFATVQSTPNVRDPRNVETYSPRAAR